MGFARQAATADPIPAPSADQRHKLLPAIPLKPPATARPRPQAAHPTGARRVVFSRPCGATAAPAGNEKGPPNMAGLLYLPEIPSGDAPQPAWLARRRRRDATAPTAATTQARPPNRIDEASGTAVRIVT